MLLLTFTAGEFDLCDVTAVKCKICTAGNEEAICNDEYTTQVLQRSVYNGHFSFIAVNRWPLPCYAVRPFENVSFLNVISNQFISMCFHLYCEVSCVQFL